MNWFERASDLLIECGWWGDSGFSTDPDKQAEFNTAVYTIAHALKAAAEEGTGEKPRVLERAAWQEDEGQVVITVTLKQAKRLFRRDDE